MRRTNAMGWEGLLENLGGWQRSFVFVVHFAMLTSMVFLQLGFVAVGWGVPRLCCLLPLVGPIAATTLLMGTSHGVLQGMLAGILLFMHAKLTPGGITEYLCLTPIGAAGLAAVGLASGPLFSLTLRENPVGRKRKVSLALACLGISVVTTVFFVLGILFSDHTTPFAQLGDTSWSARSLMGNPVAQLIGNALVAAVFVLPADTLAHVHQQPRSTMSVRVLFRLQLLCIVMLGLLIGSASAFVRLTQFCRIQTDNDMAKEAASLSERITAIVDGQGGVQNARPMLEAIVDTYDLETDGTIAVLGPDGFILSNNHAYDGEGGRLVSSAREMAHNDHISMTFVNEGHEDAVRMGYVRVVRAGELYVMLIRPFTTVFRDRLVTMASIATTTVILITLVCVYAARLLSVLLADPIDQTNETLGHITAGKLDEVIEVRGSSEFSSLSDGINAGVSAIRAFAEERARRIEEDLATAARIQQSALPRKSHALPDEDAFDIFANMSAARDVGGDFYDFFLVDDHVLGLLIADVSGKGIPAALFMMEAKNEIASRMQSLGSLSEAMDAANATLCVGNDEAMFVTVWAATLDWQTGILTYVNAGHNPPLLRRGNTWEWLPDNGGPIMGIGDFVSFESHELHLDAGDALLLYTDGVTEAMDPENHLYGEDRLLALLQAHADLDLRALDKVIREDLARWADGAEQSDDITMLSLELRR